MDKSTYVAAAETQWLGDYGDAWGFPPYVQHLNQPFHLLHYHIGAAAPLTTHLERSRRMVQRIMRRLTLLCFGELLFPINPSRKRPQHALTVVVVTAEFRVAWLRPDASPRL